MSGGGKLISILIFFLFIGIVIWSNSFFAYEPTWQTEKQIREANNQTAIVIKCDFDSLNRKDFLDNNQFEWSDSLIYARFYVLDSTKDIRIDSITITSPSKDTKQSYEMEGTLGNQYLPKSYKAKYLDAYHPLQFNEEGYWTIEFDLNKSAFVYECDCSDYSISGSSKVRELDGGKKTLNILSPTVVQQIEDGDKQLRWVQYGVIVAIIIGIITILVMIANARYKKKPSDEQIEQRRGSIIPIIARAIDDDAEHEFRWLNEAIQSLEQGKIRELPSHITSDILNEARWRDFQLEYPDIYDEIEEYVILKNDYVDRFRHLEESIKSAINELRNQNPDINNRIQEIKDDRHVGNDVSSDAYYRNDFEGAFVLAIRENENSLRQRRVHDLFAQFDDVLLGIRDNPEVREHIDALQGYLDDLRRDLNLWEDLMEKRGELMHKYHIFHEDMDAYRRNNNP